MGSWLLTIIDQLQQFEVTSVEDNGRRMASALTIVFCFYILIPKPLRMDLIPFEYIEKIFYLLFLRPDIDHLTCMDLDFVLSLIPPTNRKEVSDAIIGFSVQLSHHKLLNSPQWLYAIPLIHFLRGTLKPFQKLPCDLHNTTWADKYLGLGHVRKSTNEMHHG